MRWQRGDEVVGGDVRGGDRDRGRRGVEGPERGVERPDEHVPAGVQPPTANVVPAPVEPPNWRQSLDTVVAVDAQADTVRVASLRFTPDAVPVARADPPVDTIGTPCSVTEPATPPTLASGYANAIRTAVLWPAVTVVVTAGPRRVPSGVR